LIARLARDKKKTKPVFPRSEVATEHETGLEKRGLPVSLGGGRKGHELIKIGLGQQETNPLAASNAQLIGDWEKRKKASGNPNAQKLWEKKEKVLGHTFTP